MTKNWLLSFKPHEAEGYDCNISFQDFKPLEHPFSYYMEMHTLNIKTLQKWLSNAIKCTRPPGHHMGTGDYAVWKFPVLAEDVPYTTDFLKTYNPEAFQQLMNTTENRIR